MAIVELIRVLNPARLAFVFEIESEPNPMNDRMIVRRARSSSERPRL